MNIVWNLIPTEILEYRVYADWLEDQGVILTAAARKGILPLDEECGCGWGSGDSITAGCIFDNLTALCFPDCGQSFGCMAGYGDRSIGFGCGDGMGTSQHMFTYGRDQIEYFVYHDYVQSYTY